MSSVHRWDDIRIFHKEAQSLSKGYRVELHAPAPFAVRKIDRVNIFGLPQWEKVRDRSLARKELFRRIRSAGADIYHFHDPELILVGLYIKIVKNKPVIYDIHEDYPAYIRSKEWIPGLLRLPVAYFFRVFEYIATLYFDILITATPAIADQFPSPRKTLVVSNYPRINRNQTLPVKEKTVIRFVYAGSLEEIRGINEMCQAFASITAASDSYKVELHVAGKLIGSKQYQQALLHIFNHPAIFYHGQMRQEEVKPLLDRCHVGIIPFLPVPNHINAIPNKLFDYMEAGLMLLVSNFKMWSDLLEKYNIGITFNPLNVNSIAQSMNRICQNPEIIEAMGKSSFETVHRHFIWDTMEKKLFAAYKELLKD